MKMEDTSAELPNQSSTAVMTHGNSHQHLGLAVAHLLTKIGDESLNNSEKELLVLFALFKGIIKNTYSGDTVALSVYEACDLLQGYLPEDEVKELANKIIRLADRKPHP